MAVPVSQQRKLAQLSGNMCAFPGCRLLLTAETGPDSAPALLGEMAHIVAESPKGPRGVSPLSEEERNLCENLILLCNQHHQLIDSKEALATYTVERLLAMKRDHEEWVERTLGGRANVDPATPLVADTVYSNVLPVIQMPRYIYGAPCEATKEADIRPVVTKDGAMLPFVLRGGWLWAFQDLRDPSGPFAEFVTHTEAEQFLSREWWKDPDKLAWFIALLNRALNKLTGRLGLRLDREHARYYFEPEAKGTPRVISYKPLNAAKATRSVVWEPKKKATGEGRGYWLHRAVSLQFLFTGGTQWCLSIRPELRVTSDGFESLEGKEIGRRVTRKKARLFNYDLLSEVHFWRDFLGRSTPRIILPFGSTGQSLVVSTTMGSGRVEWPGIPAEHDVQFKNVEYVDDLLTWFEAADANALEADDLADDDWADQDLPDEERAL